MAIVLEEQTYNTKDKHKKPQQEGWLSPTKRASAAKIN